MASLPGKRQRHLGDGIFAKNVALVQLENVRPEPPPRGLYQKADASGERRRRNHTIHQPTAKIRDQQPQPKADADDGGGLLREETKRDEQPGKSGALPAPPAQRRSSR